MITSKHMLVTEPSQEYELIDSGEGKKLERYGNFIFSRPDPQALWPKHLPVSAWQKADLEFIRKGTETKWKVGTDVPKEWPVHFAGITLFIRPTSFKHTGLFPEQEGNWQWLAGHIRQAKRPVRIINLFGYTGGATLVAAGAGAEVTHVDGSKAVIAWARENAAASGLAEAPIRWILDDAKAFLKKEIKRGKRYDGIIMDPPTFGYGPKKELWKIEEDFMELLALAREALTDRPLFVLASGYASGYSATAYENCFRSAFGDLGGTIESGELAIRESGARRLLPAGIFVRWSRE